MAKKDLIKTRTTSDGIKQNNRREEKNAEAGKEKSIHQQTTASQFN
jgi:hypothetical protein